MISKLFLGVGWLSLGFAGMAGAQEALPLSLAEALDAGSAVSWTTSQEKPFLAQELADRVNGNAACVVLQQGEEAWLEATVEGPGRFDFEMDSAPGGQPYYLARTEQWVNGVKFLRQESGIWLTGGGTHHIRIVVKNPMPFVVGISVDEASWNRLVPDSADASWTSSSPEAMRSFSTGGVSGAPLKFLEEVAGENSWVEKTVMGPGVLEWHSQGAQRGNDPFIHPIRVTVNGGGSLPGWPADDFTKMRLALPAGEHKIRWAVNPLDVDTAVGPFPAGIDQAVCRLSGIQFTASSPAIHQVMGPSGIWLLYGEEDGQVVAGEEAGTLAYLVPEYGFLIYSNASPNIQSLSGRVFDQSHGWRTIGTQLQPGEFYFWSLGDRDDELMPKVGTVAITEIAPVSLADALDMAGGVSSTGWLGVLSSSESFDGVDLAISAGPGSVAKMTLSGAGKVKFHWRKTGTDRLYVRLNGGVIPVAAATAEWTAVEISVGGGENVLEWAHTANPNAITPTPGVAMLDAVSFEPIAARSLDEVTGGAGLGLVNSIESPANLLWKAVSYRDENGVLVDAARVMQGDSAMKTTIEGPAEVTFRGRYFQEPSVGFFIDGGKAAPRVEVTDGIIIGEELTAMVDGVLRARISGASNGSWIESSFVVPAGVHEVSWRLSTAYSSGVFRPSKTVGLQAWVDDISVKNARMLYDEWALTNVLLEGLRGPNDDADGDGVTNLVEFAYGSDAMLAGSKPASVQGAMVGGSSYRLMVPYVSERANVVVERSEDLKTWTLAAGSLLSVRPPLNSPLPHTATHQVLDFPKGPADGAGFFRVRVMLSDTE